MRIILNTSECPKLSEKIYINPIMKNVWPISGKWRFQANDRNAADLRRMDRGIRSGISEIYRSDPETELRGGDSAEAKKMTKI